MINYGFELGKQKTTVEREISSAFTFSSGPLNLAAPLAAHPPALEVPSWEGSKDPPTLRE